MAHAPSAWWFTQGRPKASAPPEPLTTEQRKQRIARWLKKHRITKCPAFMPEVEPRQEPREPRRRSAE